MGSPLPEIGFDEFRDRLSEVLTQPIRLRSSEQTEKALWYHYLELRRWNPRLSLVGPGTASEVLERHYAESLLGLELLDAGVENLVDIGSGAGFPGIVLAAARPEIQVTLVEPREKKWAFLSTSIRRSGLLSCKVVNARVERPFPASLKLPETIDRVSTRALAVPPQIFTAFIEHSPAVRFLVWCGKETPELPQGLAIQQQVSINKRMGARPGNRSVDGT